MSQYDVLGIGNAIVDILAHVEDDFLTSNQLTKGSMALVSYEQAQALYKGLPPTTEKSGGSAANTVAGVTSFGGRSAFIGKVAKDQFGKVFTHDLQSLGIAFNNAPADSNTEQTAQCLVAVTPDAERTMSTYLGIAGDVTEEDLDENLIKNSAITYVEGYLWDRETTKDTIRTAIEKAHHYGNKVALTLSDTFCVDRHRREFLQLIQTDVDILFANEAEICSLFEVEDVAMACSHIASLCSLATITQSAKGALVVTQDSTEHYPISQSVDVKDTTGAGDLYASGFLYGLTHDYSHAECAALGHLAASEVISHIGARPEIALKTLLEAETAS